MCETAGLIFPSSDVQPKLLDQLTTCVSAQCSVLIPELSLKGALSQCAKTTRF